MSSITYSSLTADKSTDGSIKSWINVSTIPSTLILTMAEQWLYQRLRVRQMLHTDSSLVCVQGSRYVALPSDYREGRRLDITGTEAVKVVKKNVEFVEGLLTYDPNGNLNTGRPRYWYSAADQLAFDVAALSAYPLKLVYYRELEALSADNETNFLTDRASRALYACCMAFANEFQKDETAKTYWLAIAEREVQRLNAESEGEETRSAEIDPYVV